MHCRIVSRKPGEPRGRQTRRLRTRLNPKLSIGFLDTYLQVQYTSGADALTFQLEGVTHFQKIKKLEKQIGVLVHDYDIVFGTRIKANLVQSI